MKKVIAVILSAAMALSLAACGGGKDAKTIYNEAVKKNSELTSMDMDSAMTMTLSMEGETLDMGTDISIQMEQIGTDQMKYFASTTMNILGQSMDADVFYTDGYFYQEADGQKIKYAMDLTEVMDQVKQNTSGSTIDAESMKELTAKKDGDNQILTFTADPAKMDAYIKDAMSGLSEAAGLDGMELNIKDVSGEYVINKEGYYTSMEIKMDFDMTMDGESINVVLDMSANVKNPGQAVTVNIPSTEGYQEVDPATMQPK